jgi:hypothetical protein
MTNNDWLMLVAAGYAALILLLLFANWWRSRLLKWARGEIRWLEKESEELQLMEKRLTQQNTWDATRGHYGNVLMNSMFRVRRKEYNRRRVQLMEVTHKIQRLLPW